MSTQSANEVLLEVNVLHPPGAYGEDILKTAEVLAYRETSTNRRR